MAHDDYRADNPAAVMVRAAERTLLIAQIETVEGLNEVEAIAATPGIDVVWLGHFDLSNFMGIPGQFRHPGVFILDDISEHRSVHAPCLRKVGPPKVGA